jgi:hypothetical protein
MHLCKYGYEFGLKLDRPSKLTCAFCYYFRNITASCQHGIEAAFYVFAYLLPASVCGLVLLTLRLAWMKVESQLSVEGTDGRDCTASNLVEEESYKGGYVE